MPNKFKFSANNPPPRTTPIHNNPPAPNMGFQPMNQPNNGKSNERMLEEMLEKNCKEMKEFELTAYEKGIEQKLKESKSYYLILYRFGCFIITLF